MPKPFEEVIEEFNHRLRADGRVLEFMRQARDHVNGDVVIPLPEMDSNEKPAVANLIAHGLDQTAMRVSSTLPNLHFPPLNAGEEKGRGSEDWARRRRLAVAGWWQQTKLNLKMRRLSRWVIGYGRAPLYIRPNFDREVPDYDLRDPLGTFPALTEDYDDVAPPNVIFAFKRTLRWLRDHYPEGVRELERTRDNRQRTLPDSTVLTLLEYVDDEEFILGFLAPKANEHTGYGLWTPGGDRDLPAGGIELMRAENLAGVCPVVTPKRITFDRLQGQFNQLFGIYHNQATLMALETIAVTKGIFPDIAVVGSTPGRTPSVVGGEWKDGRTGEVNVIKDGRVDVVQLNPGFMTQPLIDRHERTMRVQGGVPAQWGGESPSRIATGRLGDQVLSATVDFPIQEYQEILEVCLYEANKRAIAVSKAYFGDQKKSFHVSFAKANGQADYTPNTHFETDEHLVSYAQPGADINALVIGAGQRLGLGTLSRKTWMYQDPLIDDPEQEDRSIMAEGLRSALMDFIREQVVQGALDPQDVLFLAQEVEKGTTLDEAWERAQERAQQRQAEMAEGAQQMDPMDPGAQPGLSPAELQPAVGAPEPSMENLSQMLGSLRQPRMLTSPMGERQAPNIPVGG